MEITAAVLRSPDGPYALETVTLADPAPHQVLVKIVGTGMCHSDIIPRGEGAPSAPPIVTGHEGAGIVEAIGADVSTISIGDHVVLTYDLCGECVNCRSGQPAYCSVFTERNCGGRDMDSGTTCITDADGEEIHGRWFGQSSFATYAIANENNTVVIDPEVPLELVGPLGCGIMTGAGSALVSLDVQPGTSFAVFGAGAVGLSALLAAKAVGVSTLIAVDLSSRRLELARELGATHTINGSAPDIAEQIIAITGDGAQYAFDTTGVPAVMATAVAATRWTATIGFVGLQADPLVLEAPTIIGKKMMGIVGGGVDPTTFIPRMVDMWKAGDFPFDRLIETFPLSQINEAEQSSLSGGAIKPVLIP